MPTLNFTPQLRRFVATPQVVSPSLSLRAVLEEAFAAHPQLRGYVLDDQGQVRPNVVIYVDGQRNEDRVRWDAPLQPHSQVWVLQALSGG